MSEKQDDFPCIGYVRIWIFSLVPAHEITDDIMHYNGFSVCICGHNIQPAAFECPISLELCHCYFQLKDIVERSNSTSSFCGVIIENVLLVVDKNT